MQSNPLRKPVAVVGANGHTGRFVIDELARRGFSAVRITRDVADITDPASLDRALAGAAAVINCAGPFLDTALPVVDAALRAKIPYLDVTAEQGAVQAVQSRDAQAREAAVTVVPAAAFYGGLADLLASSVLDGAADAGDIAVAVALDSWHPTKGTRTTGARNTAPRLIVRNGVLQQVADPYPQQSWTFPAPFGEQDVLMIPFSETITLSRHINVQTIESWINLTALRDVRDGNTPAPQPVDERRRSSQRFVMDVIVRSGEQSRRATVSGRDIYAVSAPIIVEALERVLASDRSKIAGVQSLAEVSDAGDFLDALTRSGDLQVEYQTT